MLPQISGTWGSCELITAKEKGMELASWGNLPVYADGSFLPRNSHLATSLKTPLFLELPVYKGKDAGNMLDCLQVILITS